MARYYSDDAAKFQQAHENKGVLRRTAEAVGLLAEKDAWWYGIASKVGLTAEDFSSRCQKNLDREQLAKIFKVKITKKNINEYRERYGRECIAFYKTLSSKYTASDIEEFAASVYKFAPREFKYSDRRVELVINLVLFMASMTASWWTYLILFPSGRQLFIDAFQKGDRESIVKLADVIRRLILSEMLDEASIRQGLAAILGKMGDSPVLAVIAAQLSDKGISISALLAAIDKIGTRGNHEIPDDAVLGKSLDMIRKDEEREN
jgi:hypothetical protein